MATIWRRGSAPRVPCGQKKHRVLVFVTIGILLVLVARCNGVQANVSADMEGVPQAGRVSIPDHADPSANNKVDERNPGSRMSKPLQSDSRITAASISMHPSSSVFVDLITPDTSYICRAVRVLPASLSSKHRQLPAVSLPVPLQESTERRMQGSARAGWPRTVAPGTERGQQAPVSPAFYNYYSYYPAQASLIAASAPTNVELPSPLAVPEPYFSASVSPTSPRGFPAPSQTLQLQAAAPGLIVPSPQMAYGAGTQYRTAEEWNPNNPRTWQSPPGQTPPPQAPYPGPSPPGETVRHPITLPVGTTVTAPVTIPITLPITSPSLSPLTIAFPFAIRGMPGFYPSPSLPNDPSPPPTSPAPTPVPLPYYPYPPYYPPRPRPFPPGGYPGYPPYYPHPPSEPSPPQTPLPSPTPPITRPPYPNPDYPAPQPPPYPQPVYPYPPYYPPPYGYYPPPQTPTPSPSPPSPPGEDENPPLPSPVPDRPTPTPRRPGRGGGSGSLQYLQAVPASQFEVHTLAPQGDREQEYDAIPPPSNSVSSPETDENGVRRSESSTPGTYPLRSKIHVQGERPDITAEEAVNADNETIEGQSALVNEQEGSRINPELFSDFLAKVLVQSPQATPPMIPQTERDNGLPIVASVRVRETTPSATINKDGININPSAFDQLMKAIVAKIDSPNRSEPLFLPSICPACKVDIVTYAPIQMPEPDVESFERARDQLYHLQRQRIPQGVQPARGANGQVADKQAVEKASTSLEEKPTDADREEEETATPPQSTSNEQTTEANDGGNQEITGDISIVAPRITTAFLDALHAAEGKETQTPEDATKPKVAVATPEMVPETEDDLSNLFHVNRRRRPKEFRALFRERDGTPPSSHTGATFQETYTTRNIRLSATQPLKKDKVTGGTDPATGTAVYRSRLDAGEDEGTFVVMYACYHPENKVVEPLLTANLEVRVAHETPLPVHS